MFWKYFWYYFFQQAMDFYNKPQGKLSGTSLIKSVWFIIKKVNPRQINKKQDNSVVTVLILSDAGYEHHAHSIHYKFVII